ncbi:MAG TPA: GNAT family N-acetyltransferase [Gemmataceae bacterium]|jgi:GNAT superfamily N-acetyltransferase|nr:GNAT family N-acetyltransferase [Gemmataceae bacterium]
MAGWSVEKLDESHDRDPFSCGNSSLDVFLKRSAGQYARKRIGRTYVAVADGERRVAGFYTIAVGSFSVDFLPDADRKRLPNHPVPGIHLGRLAVDSALQGQGLGKLLLFHFLMQSAAISELAGAYAVDVYAKDDVSRSFYEKYGFVRLQDEPNHLCLPIATIEAMLGKDFIARHRRQP